MTCRAAEDEDEDKDGRCLVGGAGARSPAGFHSDRESANSPAAWAPRRAREAVPPSLVTAPATQASAVTSPGTQCPVE